MPVSVRQAKILLGRSREGAWIEIAKRHAIFTMLPVAPVRERGLKLMVLKTLLFMEKGRSREGAWIEILYIYAVPAAVPVSLP